MIKRVLSSLLLFLFALTGGKAQNKKTFVFTHNVCGFADSLDLASIDYEEADSVTIAYIKRICNVAGIENRFVIAKAPIKTAASTFDKDLGRCIFYSTTFFTGESRQSYEVDERKVLILAHEIGHFLNNDIIPSGTARTECELFADRFAGSVLCRMGLSLSSCTAFLGEVCGEDHKGNYPKIEDRKKALEEGFRAANCKGDYSPPAFEREEVMNLLRNAYPNSIFFEYDRTVLDTLYHPMLDSLVKKLKASGQSIQLNCYYSIEYFNITGEGQSSTAAHGLQQAKDIGNSVKTYFVNSGVNAKKIKIKSFGQSFINKFSVTKDSEFGRQLNRRVDIKYLDNP